jgi:hypothetical protein
MRWTLLCAECEQTLWVRREQVGLRVLCPCCGAALVVRPDAAEPPAQRSAGEPSPSAGQLATSAATPPPGRPFWRRRWLVAGLGAAVLLTLLLGVVGATVTEHLGGEQPEHHRRTMMPPDALPRPPMAGKRMGRLPKLVERAQPLEFRPTAVLDPLLGPVGGRAGAALPLVVRIAPCLAVAGDPARDLLLAASADGVLRWYETKSFRLLGSCRLHQPAYHLAFDPATNRLYTASAARRNLAVNSLGECDYAAGDIHAYDLSGLLGKTSSSEQQELKPRHRSPLGASIAGLLLSADGSSLCYLAETPGHAAAGRILTTAWRQDRTLDLPSSGSIALIQAPGGGTIYALAGGNVHLIEPDTFTLRAALRVGVGISAFAAGAGDRLFLLERKSNMFVQVVDVPRRRIVAIWPTTLQGRSVLRSSPDGTRLYIGCSAVFNGFIRAANIGKDGAAAPVASGEVLSNGERLIRGAILLGPDGRFLITGSGLVFRSGA